MNIYLKMQNSSFQQKIILCFSRKNLLLYKIFAGKRELPELSVKIKNRKICFSICIFFMEMYIKIWYFLRKIAVYYRTGKFTIQEKNK